MSGSAIIIGRDKNGILETLGCGAVIGLWHECAGAALIPIRCGISIIGGHGVCSTCQLALALAAPSINRPRGDEERARA